MGRKHKHANQTMNTNKHGAIAPQNGSVKSEGSIVHKDTAKKDLHVPLTTVKHIDVPLDESLRNHKLFHDVDDTVCFMLMDGRKLRNLLELVDALDTMGDDVYHHHVNESRNDFYNWIHDVYQDIDLANKLLENPSRHHVQKSIMRHMLKKIPLSVSG